jgi:hypothetical protein
MPALSPAKKERVGLGGSRVATKENKIAKAEDGVHGSATKKIETYVYYYSEIFYFLKF